MVKNPNWQEADQLAIYKRGRGVELEVPITPASGQSGTSGFQVRRPNPLDHATSLKVP